MTETAVLPTQNDMRVICAPALISLGVTLLRLTGELLHWSGRWFSSETGGTDPQGVSWVIGITWLAVPFGIYFAMRLARAGQGPRSAGRMIFFGILGLAVIYFSRFLFRMFPGHFPEILIPLWLCWVVAAALQYFGWPSLFKILLGYGLAARIPVVLIMFFAMLGNWGTHYDYVGMPPQFSMPLIPKYLWLAFFPQLVAWVAFTITVGTLAGVIATAILRPGSAGSQP